MPHIAAPLQRQFIATLVLSLIASSCAQQAPASPDNAIITLEAFPNPSTARSGIVGDYLAQPIQVRAVRAGVAIPAIVIHWSTAIGNGSLSDSSSSTNSDGIASTRWQLGGGAGPQQLKVRGDDIPALTLQAVATHGSAATLLPLGETSVAAISGSSVANLLRSIVRDSFGNPVPHVVTHWTVVSGSAQLSAANSTTDSRGVAQLGVVLPSTGSSVIRAVLATVPGASIDYQVTALAAPSAEVTITIGNNVFSPATITVPLHARVRWTMRNTSGVAHYIVSSGEPSFPGVLDPLVGDGTSYDFVFGAVGTYRYECSLHSGMKGVVVVE